MNPLLIDLLIAGSNSYVAWLRNAGTGRGEIYRRLQERFPLASTTTLLAAIDRGIRAFDAAAMMNDGGAAFRLLLGQIPGGPCNGPGVRYTLVANIADPTTGTIRPRTFQINTATSVTLGQLAINALEAAMARYQPSGARNPDSTVPSQFIIAGIDVIAVERNC